MAGAFSIVIVSPNRAEIHSVDIAVPYRHLSTTHIQKTGSRQNDGADTAFSHNYKYRLNIQC
jgi:hypothetical protein